MCILCQVNQTFSLGNFSHVEFFKLFRPICIFHVSKAIRFIISVLSTVNVAIWCSTNSITMAFIFHKLTNVRDSVFRCQLPISLFPIFDIQCSLVKIAIPIINLSVSINLQVLELAEISITAISKNQNSIQILVFTNLEVPVCSDNSMINLLKVGKTMLLCF